MSHIAHDKRSEVVLGYYTYFNSFVLPSVWLWQEEAVEKNLYCKRCM